MIALIDTRTATPECVGTLIGTFATVTAAFSANDEFQRRCGAPHIVTTIVTLRENVLVGDLVHASKLAKEGEKSVRT